MKNEKQWSLKFGMGLPYREYYFSDDRVHIRANQKSGGFDLVGYHGLQPIGSQVTILEGEPISLMVDGIPCRFEEIEIYPFGFENVFQVGDKRVKYWLCAEGKQLIFAFPEANEIEMVIPRSSLKQIQGDETKRIWDPPHFKKEQNALCFSLSDLRRTGRPQAGLSVVHVLHHPKLPDLVMEADVHFAITATAPLHYKYTGGIYSLTATKAKGIKEPLVLALIFADSQKELQVKIKEFQKVPEISMNRQKERYRLSARKLPQLSISEYTHLPHFFAVQPLYIESMKIPEGGIRGAQAGYWIWDWDALQAGFGLLQAGQYEEVRKLLEFFQRLKRKDGHVGMPFTHDFRRLTERPLGMAGDLLIPALLFRYFICSGDVKGVESLYPHAKQIFSGIAGKCQANGLYATPGIWPDFPEEFGRRKWGYVALEMGWWYEACRSMDQLAGIVKDRQTQQEARELIVRIKANFLKTLYNSETGYLYEAVDPETGKGYDIAHTAAIVGCMHGLYGEELVGEKIQEIASFSEANFLSDNAIRFVPAWEKRGVPEWTGIKNNWMTFQDLMIGKLLRRAGRGKAVERMVSLLDQHFGWFHFVFEGKPLCFTNPVQCSARWLSYSSRSWYSFLIEAAAGIEADLGGFTYIPCDTSLPVKLTDLPFRQSQWAIDIQGSGAWVKEFVVDGKIIKGSYKVPLRYMERGQHTLKIIRGGEEPDTPVLLEAICAGVEKVNITSRKLTVVLKGQGRIPIKFYAPRRPILKANNQEVNYNWDGSSKIGRVEIELPGSGEMSVITIG